jgi:hypothetical protein
MRTRCISKAWGLGFVIPRTQEYSAKVKELFHAGLIKAEQIKDCDSGELIWVCNGLSNEAKNTIYRRKAKEANDQVQAQLRAVMAPFLSMPAPPELASKLEDIRRALEKAISEIRLFSVRFRVPLPVGSLPGAPPERQTGRTPEGDGQLGTSYFGEAGQNEA